MPACGRWLVAVVGRILDVVHRGLVWIVASILGVQATLLVVQVVARYVFEESQSWIDETARIGLIWLVFLGSAVLIRERRHLAIRYVVGRLPSRVAFGVGLATTVLLAVLFVIFLSGAVEAWDAAARLTTPSLGLPRTVTTAPALIGFGLSLVYVVELCVRMVMSATLPQQVITAEDSDVEMR